MISRYCFLLFPIAIPLICLGQNANDYFKVIKEEGLPPIEFVQQKLDDHDLIIFDDGIHSAAEPFEFYQELLKKYGHHLDYIFVEAFGINSQPHIDAYLHSETKDSSLLLKVFQDDFTGLGWRYATYYDLLSTVWDINHHKAHDAERIKVVGVDQPIYWEGLHSREDYTIFQESLIGRDFFMYKTILNYMNTFNENKKGILLTNTRHAYKNIRNSNNQPYWNCGTFFYQWHKGKTYSIRIHNATLSITAYRPKKENASIQGLDKIKYEWIKMENGNWDKAFALNGNRPVAFSLKNNIWGQTKYIGNHMLNAFENQRMFDAYDAILFLAPLDNLHISASIHFICTEPFKKELQRRIKMLHENKIETFLSKNKVNNIEEYIQQLCEYRPKTKNQLLAPK